MLHSTAYLAIALFVSYSSASFHDFGIPTSNATVDVNAFNVVNFTREKILSRSHANYLAQISIEMTDANNQINDVLSKLTALGMVLIPMNLVTGELLPLPFFLASSARRLTGFAKVCGA
ncbi:hypothetical protein B0H13DRAFT_2371203 [Mycena leptocephala]|nr:hypothetical protein B0H13DRAFT_2371203 [Mycena leptocephala]